MRMPLAKSLEFLHYKVSGAEAGIISEGVAQIIDRQGNPLSHSTEIDFHHVVLFVSFSLYSS